MFVLTYEEILIGVRKVVAEALGVNEHEVVPTATLEYDLDAESIDFLDIMFRAEAELHFREPKPTFASLRELIRMELIPYSNSLGLVSDEGVAHLKRMLPWADIALFEEIPHLSTIRDLFTVGLLVSYIQHATSTHAAQPKA